MVLSGDFDNLMFGLQGCASRHRHSFDMASRFYYLATKLQAQGFSVFLAFLALAFGFVSRRSQSFVVSELRCHVSVFRHYGEMPGGLRHRAA